MQAVTTDRQSIATVKMAIGSLLQQVILVLMPVLIAGVVLMPPSFVPPLMDGQADQWFTFDGGNLIPFFSPL